MGEMMTAMEPGMRKGMAEAYAVHFTGAELADIGAFFSTPSGAAYARKSYALASDPRIVAAAMESMPAMMESFATIAGDIEAATADLLPRRDYADFTPAQLSTLVDLTGLSEAEIAEGMAEAEAKRQAGAAMGASE